MRRSCLKRRWTRRERKLLRVDLTDAVEAEEMFTQTHGRGSRAAPPVHRGQRAQRAESGYLIFVCRKFLWLNPNHRTDCAGDQHAVVRSREKKLPRSMSPMEIKNSLSRLLHVRDHFARPPLRATASNLATAHPARDGNDLSLFPNRQASQVRQNLGDTSETTDAAKAVPTHHPPPRRAKR